MFPRYVFIAFYALAYAWNLGFLQILCHSFLFVLLVHELNHFSSDPHCEEAFHCSYMLETNNSCFSWILLCLICFFIDYMKAWKWSRHCFFWAQLPRPYFQLSLWVCEHLSPLLSLFDCHSYCLDDDCCFFLNPQFYVVVWVLPCRKK